MEAPAPAIALRQRSAQREKTTRRWRIAWTVENRGGEILKLCSVRLPHGQFKAEEQKFLPALILGAGGAAEFATPVHCEEPPGLVTENAFAIFETIWSSTAWRIFVRIRVEVNGEGEPSTAVQLITAQRAGFSRQFQT